MNDVVVVVRTSTVIVILEGYMHVNNMSGFLLDEVNLRALKIIKAGNKWPAFMLDRIIILNN